MSGRFRLKQKPEKKFKTPECFRVSLGLVHLHVWQVAESRPVSKSHLMYWNFSCAPESHLLVNMTSYCPKVAGGGLSSGAYLHKAAHTAGTQQPAASHKLPWPRFLKEDRNKSPSDQCFADKKIPLHHFYYPHCKISTKVSKNFELRHRFAYPSLLFFSLSNISQILVSHQRSAAVYQQLIILIVRETGRNENCSSYGLSCTGFFNARKNSTAINMSSVCSANLMVLLAQLLCLDRNSSQSSHYCAL